MPRLRFAAALLLAPLLNAQYQDLATERAGAKAAFSSRLSLRGETRNDLPKLFEIDSTGQLRTLRDTPPIVSYPGDRYPANFPTLTRPEFDSAGSILAYTGERWCIGGSGCVGVELRRGNISWLDGSREAAQSGIVRISADGRWAVGYNPTSLASPYRFYRVNLETGWSEFAATGLTGTAGAGRRVIANDGTVLNVPGGRELVIRKPAQRDVTIPLAFSTAYVTIANNAAFAVAQTYEEVPTIWLVDLTTRESFLILWAYEGVTQPALSDDGMTMLFLSGANYAAENNTLAVQVWSMDMITGRLHQWTHDEIGFAEATISGDGLAVYAVTKDGRMLRADRLSGEVRQLLGPSPVASSPETTVWAPGSRYVFEGAGLDGSVLRWQGVEVQVVRRDSRTLEFIIPWDAAPGQGSFELDQPSSPFQPHLIPGEMRAVAPLFIKSNEFIHGLRQDGSPLTVANQAKPGETVKLFMRGLGPVDSAGQTTTTVLVYTADGIPVEVVSSTTDLGTPGTYLLGVKVPTYALDSININARTPGMDAPETSGFIPVNPN